MMFDCALKPGPLAAINLRIEVQRLADGAVACGEAAVAAILAAAVRTLDQRISLEVCESPPGPRLDEYTLSVLGRDVVVRVEPEIWDLFVQLGRDLFDAPERMAAFVHECGPTDAASMIRLFVLNKLLQRSRGGSAHERVG